MNKSNKKRGDLPDSPFVINVRKKLEELNSNNIWRVGGKTKSLRIKHLRTNEILENKLGKKWRAHIWMRRPYKECTFEIADSLTESEKNIELRERIAESIRSYLIRNSLPEKIKTATGATIIKIDIFLSENRKHALNKADLKEIDKIVEFSKFLECSLNEKFLNYFEHKIEELLKEEKD